LIQSKFHISKLEDLNSVAELIISLIPIHKIFLMQGQMGAGKTTLVNVICSLLKTVEQPSSPTFSIVNTYNSLQIGEVYHFDFYRIKGEREAIESGLDELIYSGKICFIEWSEKIAKLLPNNFVSVHIEMVNEKERIITVEY
jgi:tRNA threonylcarbamoyladenosine biosynthesis protein TsaE